MYEIEVKGYCSDAQHIYDVVEAARIKVDLDTENIAKAIYVVGRLINFVTRSV